MKLLFRGPVTTASGYGVHARQLLKGLLRSNKFDISVMPINWGNTSFIYDDDSFTQIIYKLVQKFEEEQRNNVQYDISFQVTIPNEFQKIAPMNICVTAGIEVDRASPEWIKKVNENADLLIVPSTHSANSLCGISYQDEKGNELKVTKPVAVIPESFDDSIFNTDVLEESDKFNFDTKFNFIFAGLGLDKANGEDRKNISTLVKLFCEVFKNNKDVGLVLKTGIVNNSKLDLDMTQRRILDIKASVGCNEFPKIYLVHGRLTDKDMARLYKSCDSFVTLTHGEGYGLPTIEAAACGLPIIATNWSGHLDFLHINNSKKFIPIDFDLKEVPESCVWNGVIEKGSRWAYPKEDDFKKKLYKVYASFEKPKEWATELADHLKKNYNFDNISNFFEKVIIDFSSRNVSQNSLTEKDFVSVVKDKLNIKEKNKTLLYTMPMSAGDVYISTAVVDSLKKKFPLHRIFFATDMKYSSILKDNNDIHSVIQYENWMQNVPLCEKIFSEVYTPNLAVQMMTSNWVKGGKGRRLAEELAVQCNVELGDYKIKLDEVFSPLPSEFIVFHPGSGQGQWEARNYLYWQDIINNIKSRTDIPIIQIGAEGDFVYQGVESFVGNTSYNQLAYIISKSKLLLGIDSVSMHIAAGLGIKHVALFGSSYANSTGPSKSKALSVLLETQDRYTCDKACYKYECTVKKDHPCINEIKPIHVVNKVFDILEVGWICDKDWEEHTPTISGYMHVLNADRNYYPFVESIKSMLGFCDEVVIVDGGSDDSTLDKIKEINDDRVKLFTRTWDWDEPGMDGMQKAFARAMCNSEFLWQMDADEVVHEKDYEKIKLLVKKFPKNALLMHLPVVELWGDSETFRTDRHSWKWRLSRNDFKITHGINKNAKVINEKTGKVYAKKGMSDGCEYIDIMTSEYIPHFGFYSNELEMLRRTNPEKYGQKMNELFDELPSVYHYSWADIPRKIKNFRDFWDKCWSNLYCDENREQRFFSGKDMKDVTDEEIFEQANKMKSQGGEHNKSIVIKLNHSNPEIMKDWLQKAN